MLALTTELVGDAAWAAEHGVARELRCSSSPAPTRGGGSASSPTAATSSSEPNGAVVDARGRDADDRLVPLSERAGSPRGTALAQAAAALTRDAAALLTAA